MDKKQQLKSKGEKETQQQNQVQEVIPSAIHEMANDLLAQSKGMTTSILPPKTVKPMQSAKPVFLNSSMKNIPHKNGGYAHKSKSPYGMEQLLSSSKNSDAIKAQQQTRTSHHVGKKNLNLNNNLHPQNKSKDIIKKTDHQKKMMDKSDTITITEQSQQVQK